jgi:L-lysine 6-oxidase
MTKQYRIHPKIGVARAGNSPHEFYIGPEKTGGLPIECDRNGNPKVSNGREPFVNRFKDAAGAIKRQAARFKIFEYDEPGAGREVSLHDGEMASIQWTVHLANKKAIWYNFSELKGDLMFGPENSYENQHVSLRNPDVPDQDRQGYIIDPGPRRVNHPGQKVEFSVYNIPLTYPHGTFPASAQQNAGITSLGEIMMDERGRLLVLGGFGNSGGPGDITSFAGANDWFDDISDGYVLATIHFTDGRSLDLEPAWVIVGSPKYAPELVNIITLDDCIFDIAVRWQNYNPDIYDRHQWPDTYADGPGYHPFAGFNPDYHPNYKRDIEPIITRPQSYRWVANVPSMIDFSRPAFDASDPSKKNKKNREEYFSYYRIPVPPESHQYLDIEKGPNQLFSKDGLPLMPLNSGDNSVKDYHLVYKFLTLTLTQYFFMKQWSLGKFTTGDALPDDQHGVTVLDRQVIGNCVGGPFSPGIEVTWLMRNPIIYSSPYQIKVAHWHGSNETLQEYYALHGLSTTSDPQDGLGTQPGDLTKRMAIPWQADFFDCTVQTPNITIPDINQSPADDGIQIPPCYYVYWWPPQSPMFVIAGSLGPVEQTLDAYVTYPPIVIPNSSGSNQVYQAVSNPTIVPVVAAGQQVPYSRGIYSFNQMVSAWKDLGFILNEGTDWYPYFVEKERNTTSLAQGIPLGVK